jgi:hypothetical protein
MTPEQEAATLKLDMAIELSVRQFRAYESPLADTLNTAWEEYQTAILTPSKQ